MANHLGAIAANLLSAGARLLGYLLYGVLRVIYRRRERTIVLAAVLVLAPALFALAWWLL